MFKNKFLLSFSDSLAVYLPCDLCFNKEPEGEGEEIQNGRLRENPTTYEDIVEYILKTMNGKKTPCPHNHIRCTNYTRGITDSM